MSIIRSVFHARFHRTPAMKASILVMRLTGVSSIGSVFGDLSAHLGRPSKTALMILRAVSQYSGQARGTFSDPADSPLAMFSKP
jgi:hypothetical protein